MMLPVMKSFLEVARPWEADMNTTSSLHAHTMCLMRWVVGDTVNQTGESCCTCLVIQCSVVHHVHCIHCSCQSIPIEHHLQQLIACLGLKVTFMNTTLPRCGFSVTETILQLTAAPGSCCRRQMRDLRSVLQFTQIHGVGAEEPSAEGKAALHGCTVTAVLELWLEKGCMEDDHMLYRLNQAAPAGAWATQSCDPSHFTSLAQQKAGHSNAAMPSPDACLPDLCHEAPRTVQLAQGGHESIMSPAQLV